MLRKLKKLSTFFAILSFCLLLVIHPAVALNEPPAVGGTLPPLELAVPQDEGAKSYLGLSGSGQFTVPDINAQAVIIEVFSMY
jgi:hypothetical protein